MTSKDSRTKLKLSERLGRGEVIEEARQTEDREEKRERRRKWDKSMIKCVLI